MRRQPRAALGGSVRLYNVFVVGDPKGQPRPRAFARNGKARVYDPGTAEHWKSQIARRFEWRGPGLREYELGALAVVLQFRFARPKSHLRKDGTLKPDAILVQHVSKPDADNLAKAVLDALTTVGVWRDDAQVAELVIVKRYANPGDQPGCQITIHTRGF